MGTLPNYQGGYQPVLIVSNKEVHRRLVPFFAFEFFSSFLFFAPVLIPFFSVWGKLSQFQIQSLQSWFLLVLFVCQMPTGVFADHIGRKYSLGLGCFLSAIGTVVYTSRPDFLVFMWAETFFGLGCAFVAGADQAFIFETLTELGRTDRKEWAFGTMSAISLTAMLMAAPIGSWIAGYNGVTAPMAASAIPFLVAAMVAFSLQEPKQNLPTQGITKSQIHKIRTGLSILRTHTQLRWLVLNSTLVSVAGYFVIWIYQGLLGRVNVPHSYFGYYHTGLVGVQVLAASQFGRLGALPNGIGRYLSLTALATSFGFLLAAWQLTHLNVIIFLICGGLGLTRQNLLAAQMSPFIPTDQRATILSAIGMIRQSLLFLLNPLVGVLIDYSAPLALVMISLLPLAALLMNLKKPT